MYEHMPHEKGITRSSDDELAREQRRRRLPGTILIQQTDKQKAFRVSGKSVDHVVLAVGFLACSQPHTDFTSALNKYVKPTRSTCNVDEEQSVRHSNKR